VHHKVETAELYYPEVSQTVGYEVRQTEPQTYIRE